MIVVDTNVIVANALETMRVDLRAKDNAWVSPLLWQCEFRSALALMIRVQGMRIEEANRLFEAASEGVLEQSPVSLDVINLLAASPCSAYDLEFVAVAMQLSVPLVTYDRQVLAAFPAIAMTPEAFIAS